jgi:hypothetical protein
VTAMQRTRSIDDRIAEHEAAARYLRVGIYEAKPWLRGVVSYSGPASDHETMARRLRARRASEVAR